MNAPAHAEPHRTLTLTRSLSAAAIVFATLVRLLSTHARFPWWDLDPSQQPLPETALLPSQALALDTLVWTASIFGVGACILLKQPLRWITGALALIGSAGAMTTYLVMGARAGSAPDDAVLASAWSSAIIGAWAMTHLAADPAIRRSTFAIIAGAAWVLAAKGAFQYFVEHAATVAHYKANTGAMLAAQGLEPGSAGAREFERRLMQPEATGWVGMSNAHASVLAATLAMTLALAWSAYSDARAKRLPSGNAGVLTLTGLAAAAGLAMTGSKGGILTGILAAALTLATARILNNPTSDNGRPFVPRPRLQPLLTTLATTLPILALAAIYARGLLGERLAERSLLFRSQYLEGAARVIADSFPLGVGPAGFKHAYNLHKPPLSPESVESPHSVFFDWLACLGAPGVAWCVLLFIWLANAGSTLARWHASAPGSKAIQNPRPAPQSRSMPPEQRVPIRRVGRAAALWLLVPLAACAVAWAREAPTVAPDEWLVRLVAVIAWLGVVLCSEGLSAHVAVPAALFAAAVALATHAQIELTTVLPATGALAFLLIALAAAPQHTPSACSTPAPGHRRLAHALPILLLLPFIFFTLSLRTRFAGWESRLRHAAEAVEPLARVRALLPRVNESPDAQRELESILLPTLPTDARPDLPTATATAMTHCAEQAADHLRAASEARPESLRADDAALRLLLAVAADTQSLNQPELARRLARRAADHIAWMRIRPSAVDAPAAASIASAYQAIHQFDPVPDNHWLILALEQWAIAAARDPTALQPVLRQIDLYRALARPIDAAASADRALALSENLRLDPLKQLTPEQKTRLKELIRSVQDSSGPAR